MASSIPTNLARPTRPLGVWLLTAYAMIFEGLSPAFAMTWFIVPGLRQTLDPSGILLLYLMILRLLSNLGVIIAAIPTFLGGNIGRWSLLVLVTLNHLLAIQNLPLLLVGPLPQEALPGLVAGALKEVVVPVIYIWYFTRRRTRPFYQLPSMLKDLPP